MKLRTLTLRGLPEPLLKALRAAATRNRRSLNAEVLVRLEEGADALGAEGPGGDALGGGAHGTSAAYSVRQGRAPPGGGAARVGDSASQSYEVRRAFEEEREALLDSDLRMTPEQRVLLADRLLDEALAVRPRPNVHTVRAFDTWEDYLAWKRTDFLR
jgi:hypothetical protein